MVNIVPVLQRFTSSLPLLRPKVGGHLVVHLPGEIMRCRVEKVIDANNVIIEIDGQPMAKSHHFRKGDVTGARRRRQDGMDVWEALEDRWFLQPKRKKGVA